MGQVPSDIFKITLASWCVKLKHEIAAAFADALYAVFRAIVNCHRILLPKKKNKISQL